MNRRSILSLSAAAVFGLALAANSATAQTKTLKEQLLGTWTLVSFDSFDASGAKVPNMEGSDLKGLAIFTDNGRMSVQYITDYPKIASKDRMKTTPAEDKAVAHEGGPTSVPTPSMKPTRPSATGSSAARPKSGHRYGCETGRHADRRRT